VAAPDPSPSSPNSVAPAVVSPPNPFFVGFRAAKANVVPGSILIGLTIALVVAYYQVPLVNDLLAYLKGLKETYGYFYSMVSAAFFAGPARAWRWMRSTASRAGCLAMASRYG